MNSPTDITQSFDNALVDAEKDYIKRNIEIAKCVCDVIIRVSQGELKLEKGIAWINDRIAYLNCMKADPNCGRLFEPLIQFCEQAKAALVKKMS